MCPSFSPGIFFYSENKMNLDGAYFLLSHALVLSFMDSFIGMTEKIFATKCETVYMLCQIHQSGIQYKEQAYMIWLYLSNFVM